MAWKEVTSHSIDIKKEKGKAFVGTYIGREDITTQMGAQIIWKFKDENDQKFGMYGFTMLNRAMNNVTEGSLCRITYTGQEKLQTKKFGLKDVHMVRVEIDDKQNGAPEDEYVPE